VCRQGPPHGYGLTGWPGALGRFLEGTSGDREQPFLSVMCSVRGNQQCVAARKRPGEEPEVEQVAVTAVGDSLH
jgi:hypothetical protein